MVLKAWSPKTCENVIDMMTESQNIFLRRSKNISKYCQGPGKATVQCPAAGEDAWSYVDVL